MNRVIDVELLEDQQIHTSSVRRDFETLNMSFSELSLLQYCCYLENPYLTLQILFRG